MPEIVLFARLEFGMPVGSLAMATVPLVRFEALALKVSALLCAVAAAPETSAPILPGVTLNTPAVFRMLVPSGFTPPSTVEVAVGRV
jgi:hypothetical protein